MNALVVGLVGAVMALGLLGTVLPVLPGVAIIWLAGFIYGLVTGFGPTGVLMMAIMTVLAITGLAAGIVLPHRRGTQSGAPRSSLLAGGALGIVGFFVIPVLGFPIGGLAGVLLAERRRLASWPAAWRTTRRVIRGLGEGVLIELATGLAMVASWATWVVLS